MDSIWRFDLDTFRAIHVGLHRDWLDPVFWLLSTSGLGWVQVALVLIVPLIFAGKYVAEKQPSQRGVFRLLVGGAWRRWSDPAFLVGPLLATILLSGLMFVAILKHVLNRERPSHLWFAHPQEDVTSYSYPSGHTTTSFAIAFILLFVTAKTPKAWIGWVALAWALLVGFSRIYRGVHWPTDVLGGLFAGLVSSSIVYLVMRRVAKIEEEPASAADN